MARRLTRWLIMVGLVVVAAVALVVPAHAASANHQVLDVYLSPDGSDTNSGLSAGDPLASLAGAQDVIRSAVPDGDVQVLIAPGTYTEAPLTWTAWVPGHSITFEPSVAQTRPVFHGTGAAGYWISVRSAAGDTNLRFVGLQVEHYSTGGINLHGGAAANSDGLLVPTDAGVNNNVISDMVFRDLGSKNVPSGIGYGGIDLVNSSNNLIVGNQFINNEDSPSPASMHGVYLAHYSQRNLVVGNRFSHVSGDPVRTRNKSNDNTIAGNVFDHSGTYSYTSDWFCDTMCAQTHPGHARECAAQGNLVFGNWANVGYNGAALPWTSFTPDGNTIAGGPGCGPDGPERIIAFANRAAPDAAS